MDRLDAMRVFVSVATRGSFAEASRSLRLSPSAVTRAVAWLEDELGLSLLTRTTRSLRLTERGAIFLESCRQILDDLDDAERRVKGEDADPRGEMTVAAPVMFGRLHVTPIVDGLLRAYPALKVRLLLSDRNVHLVEEGVDVAVRIGALADSSMVTTTLGAVSRVLVASPAYLARRGIPVAPADLAVHDLIAFEGLASSARTMVQGRPVIRAPRSSRPGRWSASSRRSRRDRSRRAGGSRPAPARARGSRRAGRPWPSCPARPSGTGSSASQGPGRRTRETDWRRPSPRQASAVRT
jgi:DNA-binding transcriptional LysR family regulator